MANKYVGIRNGGKTDEEGALTRLLNKVAASQNFGKIGTGDFLVAENGTPNMTLSVATGDIVIPYLGYFFHCWSTATQSVTVTTADPTNPRIDRLVAYIDLAVVQSTTSNNVDAIVLKCVAGTPAGSPARPNDAAVQSSVGAGNPFIDLCDVSVPASDTAITNSQLTDTRSLFQLGGGVGGIQFTLSGTITVADDQTPYWVAPKNGTFTVAYARIKTAPTGQALKIRVKKNGVAVTGINTLDISAGAQNANATGLSISYVAGDYFSIDITQVGSTVAGANLTLAVA